MEVIKTLTDVQAEMKASLDKAIHAMASVNDEVTALDVKKATLQAEVMTLSKAVEPLRQEAEGQRRATREIFLEQEKAGKELDSVKTAITRAQEDLAKQKADAEKVIEDAKVSKIRDIEAKIKALEEKLSEKQKKLDAFQAEWSK